MDLSAEGLRALNEEGCGAGRIENTIAVDEKSSGEGNAEMRLGVVKQLRIEDFDVHGAVQIIAVFAADFGHFVVVLRNPDGAAALVFGVERKFVRKLLPKKLRVASERELGFGIVHHDDVAHGRAGGARADRTFVQNGDAQSLFGKLVSAGRADDASANDDCVGGGVHGQMTPLKGSRGSRRRSATAVTNAEPLMAGRIWPASMRTEPSKMLPTMLSWRHTSPGCSLPSA